MVTNHLSQDFQCHPWECVDIFWNSPLQQINSSARFSHRYLCQCFVETNDIVIDPVPEYFNDNISPCDSNACHSFISDQSFKSNLTGINYKTKFKPMSSLPVDH